jgi:hypothetical protein
LKPADISHPGLYQFAVDQSRFAAALNKIVRGLYVHSTGKMLPADDEFRWAPWGAPLDDTMATVFDNSKLVVSYPRTFEARYFKGADQSAWFLQFYDNRPFCGIING